MRNPFIVGAKGEFAVVKELLQTGNSGMCSMRWSTILHEPNHTNRSEGRNPVKPRDYHVVPSAGYSDGFTTFF